MISATVSETEGFAEAWKVIIGLIFVLVVLYLPRGFAGLAHDFLDRFLTGRKTGSQHAAGISDASQLAE
jgi:urea transport system permease protein